MNYCCLNRNASAVVATATERVLSSSFSSSSSSIERRTNNLIHFRSLGKKKKRCAESSKARTTTTTTAAELNAKENNKDALTESQPSSSSSSPSSSQSSSSQIVTDKYNEAMKAYSKSPFEYQHEKGLYYHRITDKVICGTQAWERGSIDYLKQKERVTILFNTQEDSNFKHWKVDIKERETEATRAGVLLHRQPIVDFSFDSLREQLPEAVSEFDRLANGSDDEVVYCHCTAGMGRSPAVVIAYLYWTDDRFESLDEAYEFLTSKRPCGPKKEAIRQATVDILCAPGDDLPTRDGKMKTNAGRYYGEDSKKFDDSERVNLDSRGTKLSTTEREIILRKLRMKSRTYQQKKKKKGYGVFENIWKRWFEGTGPTDD